MEGSEGVQTGSGKHHTGPGRHPPIPQTGSGNWPGGLTAFSTWRVWRPPDKTDSADTAASLLTGKNHMQPQSAHFHSTFSQSQRKHQS